MSPKNTAQRVRVPSPKEIATSSSASGNWISSVLYVGGHQEDFGAAGNSSPANPFLTSPARKSAKGKPTLAFLRAFTQALRSLTGVTALKKPGKKARGDQSPVPASSATATVFEGDNPSRDVFKTKADVVKFVQEAVADGAKVIQQQGDAGLDNTSKFFGNRMAHNSNIWTFAIEHSGEHYGQLVVYYRANHLVPPDSRRQ